MGKFGLLILLITLVGCKNECQEASEVYVDFLEECGVAVNNSDPVQEDSVECTSDLLEIQQCWNTCAEEAGCEVVTQSGDNTDQEYLDALTNHAFCTDAC